MRTETTLTFQNEPSCCTRHVALANHPNPNEPRIRLIASRGGVVLGKPRSMPAGEMQKNLKKKQPVSSISALEGRISPHGAQSRRLQRLQIRLRITRDWTPSPNDFDTCADYSTVMPGAYPGCAAQRLGCGACVRLISGACV